MIKVQTLCWGNLGESCLTAQGDHSVEDMIFVYIGVGVRGFIGITLSVCLSLSG